ncbi:hypothetical protein FB451DRAFT_1562508, partial [Mycena latifolia]
MSKRWKEYEVEMGSARGIGPMATWEPYGTSTPHAQERPTNPWDVMRARFAARIGLHVRQKYVLLATGASSAVLSGLTLSPHSYRRHRAQYIGTTFLACRSSPRTLHLTNALLCEFLAKFPLLTSDWTSQGPRMRACRGLPHYGDLFNPSTNARRPCGQYTRSLRGAACRPEVPSYYQGRLPARPSERLWAVQPLRGRLCNPRKMHGGSAGNTHEAFAELRAAL